MEDENLLDKLPEVKLTWPCQTCGYDGNEFVSCNIDEKGQVTDCRMCKERIQ